MPLPQPLRIVGGMRRLAVVASHPIQYQAPWFRALAEVCDLTVFFCHRQSAADQGKAGFGQAFEWDVPLLEGYDAERLENRSSNTGVDRYSGCDSPSIGEHLARGDFDACLVNGWYLKSYQQAIRASRSLGIRVLSRGDSHLGTKRRMLTRAAKYLPYRWMLARIEAHLYVGRANYDYLRHYGVPDSRLFFTPHFVENERFKRQSTRRREDGTAAAVRRNWGAGEDDVVFVFVGKLIEVKRVGDFVRAVAAASRQRRVIRGAIVGSGPQEDALRALVKAEKAPVVFAGFHNQSEMPACYAAADCLVLPSAGESWGLSVNEAMACGLPAIVSDRVGAAPDLITEGQTGFTYPTGDSTALADRLLAMTELLGARQPAIRSAVEARINRYSCANAVNGTLAALAGVAREHPDPAVAVGDSHG
jgi:glycosyltransferase involved in cell wall biosynthesis